MSKKDKAKYMKNYRKDKKSHTITADKKLQEREEFIFKNDKSIKTYKDIYMRGIEYSEAQINESSNKHELELKRLKHEVKHEEQELEEKKERIMKLTEIVNDEKQKEKEASQDFFFTEINQCIKEFMKKNNIKDRKMINVNNLYDEYTISIQNAYIESGLTPQITGNELNMDKDKQKEIIIKTLQIL